MNQSAKKVIFVANIPAMPDKEKDGENFCRLFHMNDVHDMYVKASVTS
ncbi:MAG: hypothetical protein IKW59_03425 [Clostridia bacterium]|nr:hypothetical protein [Clostridia bacterium]